jgi:hypothetical protein
MNFLYHPIRKILGQFILGCLFISSFVVKICYPQQKKLLNNPIMQESRASKLRAEFNNVVDCSSDVPCTKMIDLPMLRVWLLNHPVRLITDSKGKLVEDRRGKAMLNFNDFLGFYAKYGNAIAKYFVIKGDGEQVYEKPGRGFAFNDGSDEVILVQDNHLSTVNGSVIFKMRTEVDIKDFAEDFFALMNTNKHDNITQKEFVIWMMSKFD